MRFILNEKKNYFKCSKITKSDPLFSSLLMKLNDICIIILCYINQLHILLTNIFRIYAFLKHAYLREGILYSYYICINVFDGNIILLFVLSQFAILSFASFFLSTHRSNVKFITYLHITFAV